MKILVIDNYDSFTYNLVQYIQEILEQEVDVRRNDAIGVEEVDQYDVIVLSPGPGLPNEAGIMPEVIRRYAPTKRILGVCLGHQAIGEAFGARLQNLTQVFHGIETPVRATGVGEPMFEGLPDTFAVGRYHSWVVDKDSVTDELVVTAVDDNGEIMALRHREYDVRGVQFHPESILTPLGRQMLENFLRHIPQMQSA